MSDGVGEVVGGEDRPGGGRYIHRQVGTYLLPTCCRRRSSVSRERERVIREKRQVPSSGQANLQREREREKAVTRIIPVRHPERMRVVHIR